MIDMRNGYFSNNPVGLWVHVFRDLDVEGAQHRGRQEGVGGAGAEERIRADGTPIIKSQSDLDNLTAKGYVLHTRRSLETAGRHFVCPVIKDPRRGGIAPDAFLATVRRADGTPLPVEQAFVTDFESLRTTGDYPH